MPQMEVFYDYACPYCVRGHQYLVELIGSHTDIEILWRPVEAHPRPEEYSHHTDLCVQVGLFAIQNNADMWAVTERLFQATTVDHIDYEDPAALAAYMDGLLDVTALRKALAEKTFVQANLAANDHAYEESGVWAVPAFRMDGRRLDAAEGVGITKNALADYLNQSGK